MGFPMALRIAQYAEPETTLYIYDIDTDAMNRFISMVNNSSAERKDEAGAQIRRVGCAREVAENSVCSHHC